MLSLADMRAIDGAIGILDGGTAVVKCVKTPCDMLMLIGQYVPEVSLVAVTAVDIQCI